MGFGLCRRVVGADTRAREYGSYEFGDITILCSCLGECRPFCVYEGYDERACDCAYPFVVIIDIGELAPSEVPTFIPIPPSLSYR